MIRHIVLLAWNPKVAPEQIEECRAFLATLIDHIPGIVSFEQGLNNSPEGLNHGFTEGFIVTFASAAARDAYLPHPYHERFKALAVPKLERVMVLDFEV